jgi:hypothetical protein
VAITPEDECLRASHDSAKCSGELAERWTEHGTRIVECHHHMTESFVRNQEIAERYPDSPVPPAWFDPTIAGESWDDDY